MGDLVIRCVGSQDHGLLCAVRVDEVSQAKMFAKPSRDSDLR